MVDRTATFTVLDRTPPKIEILPPTTDNHVGPGPAARRPGHVTDEIGVGRVVIDAHRDDPGHAHRPWSRRRAGHDAHVPPEHPAGAVTGPTVTLYALASDLSGNLAAARRGDAHRRPDDHDRDAAGLAGSLLVDGTMPTAGRIRGRSRLDQGRPTLCRRPGRDRRVQPVVHLARRPRDRHGRPDPGRRRRAGRSRASRSTRLGQPVLHRSRQNRIGELTWNRAPPTATGVCLQQRGTSRSRRTRSTSSSIRRSAC